MVGCHNIGFCWDKKSIPPTSFFSFSFSLLLAKFRQKGEMQNSKKFRKLSDFEGFSNRHKVQQEKGGSQIYFFK